MSLTLQIRFSATSSTRLTYEGGSETDPQGFIGVLIEGALRRIRAAREQLAQGAAEAPGTTTTGPARLLRTAKMILSELRADLDLRGGGAFAANLDDLYDYMGRRLGACLRNDRRSEGDRQRAGFCDRFPRIAGIYVRETIAERCRWRAAAVGEHYSDRLPAMATRARLAD
jgi:flagellin-specific chaperone FliS